jgi:plasmid stability protein
MPNVHVRDVPPEALETLRDAAKRHGRSLNAEIVEALVQHASRAEDAETFLQRLEEVRQRWREAHPEGFPPGLEPEAIIRRHRDGG